MTTGRRYLAALARPRALIGLGLLAASVAAALLAPVWFPGGVDAQTRDALAGASADHPFGTDELGRDIFVRTVYALRVSLSLIAVAVPVSLVIGTLLGLLGAVSAVAGTLAQRLFDLILGFPGLILGISIVLVIGPGWAALVVTIAVFAVPHFGRLARASLLAEQDREYVLAARVLGVGRGVVLMRHILPNVLDPLVVQVALMMIAGVFIEAALSIVGLGIQPPTPSLGTLLNVGVRYVSEQPMYTAGPVITLLVLSLAFNFVADALNTGVSRTAERGLR